MDNTELRTALERLRHKDKAAFEEIYHELKTPAYTIILRITQNKSLADDAMQDLFVKLFQAPPPSSVKNPRAYIFQMAHNLAVDSVKKQPNDADLEACAHLLYTAPEETADRLDLERALGTLSLQERQIITLHLNGGLKFRELAALMHLPLGTVLWKYRQAIQKLRLILDGGAL